MESCLHNWFLREGELVSTCDFQVDKLPKTGLLYEVVRIMQGRILFGAEHLRRLEKSAKLAGFDLPVSKSKLFAMLLQLIDVNKVSEGNLKIIVSGNQPENHAWFAAWFIPHSYPSQQQYTEGVQVAIMNIARNHPNIKKINDDYKQAVQQAMRNFNVYEVLIGKESMITEGSRSNVFFIQGQSVYTAPDSQVLKGITRDKVLQLCQVLGIDVNMQDIHENDINSFDAAFLTGTSPKILPIASIKQKHSFQLNNPITNRLMQAYDQVINDYIENQYNL
jgi:branched-chain amino acid aminotransferase